MKISELFYSIQGEGKRSGFPSFFVRTNFCNLRCKFESGNLCDTPYTSWEPEDPSNAGEISVEDIIAGYKRHELCDVVITGGEPAMQADELYDLCFGIKKINEDINITIETNGTMVSDFVYYLDLVSISPKLGSSTPFGTEHEKMHTQNRINIDVLKDYHRMQDEGIIDLQWKFVINTEKDMDEILELKNKIGFSDKDIYLMPEGITEEELKIRRPMVAELCKKYKVKYSDRLHILIWGNKRGV